MPELSQTPPPVFSARSGGKMVPFGGYEMMVIRRVEDLLLVVNAAKKQTPPARFQGNRESEIAKVDRVLIALQGPSVEDVPEAVAPGAAERSFMDVATLDSRFAPLPVSSSDFPDEDGFGISVAAEQAERLARALLGGDGARPVGLGARDTLRLEAALCLHGQDAHTSPVAVNVGRVRPLGRAAGRHGICRYRPCGCRDETRSGTSGAPAAC